MILSISGNNNLSLLNIYMLFFLDTAKNSLPSSVIPIGVISVEVFITVFSVSSNL